MTAQENTLSGTVIDSNKDPISEVKIYTRQGEKAIVQTDEKGRFRLHLQDSVKILVFKHDMFETKEVDLVNNDNVVIELSELHISDLFNLSINELTNMKVFVTTVSKGMKINEAPGIVSVITQEEIEKSGVRDFVDVLRMVPGFFPENDVSGIIGLGVRGNWANEGKVLVLIDGIEMNEEFYATVTYGHHFPVDLIERVEVIRGPGSAMYGGTAGLAVISIITKTANNKQDVFASANYGISGNTSVRSNLNLLYGGNINDLNYTISAHMGKGMLSNRDASDSRGLNYNLGENDNSAKQELYLNGNVNFKGADFRFIVDEHKALYTYPSLGFSNYDTYFSNYFLEASYNYKINESFNFKPKLQAKIQKPWNTPILTNDNGDLDSIFTVDLLSQKYLGSIVLDYSYKDLLNVFTGIDFDYVYGQDLGKLKKLGGSNEMDYYNLALYLEALLTSKFGNITFGGRHHINSKYGSYFVPRLAYTKIWKKMHIKALLSKSVREPRMRNIAINEDLKPEKTTTTELELGAKLYKTWNLSLNLFDIKISDAIVFSFSDSAQYGNYGNNHTRGLEFATAFQSKKVMLKSSYSYYYVISNDIDGYKILNNENDAVLVENQNLGFPSHKIYGLFSIKVLKKIDVGTTLTFLSSRYAITSRKPNSHINNYTKLKPYYLLSLNFTYNDLITEGLNMSFSWQNVLNTEYSYVQPYIGGESPIPANKSEFHLKVSYSL